MQDYSIAVEEDPSFDDIRFLMHKLHEHNVSQTGLEGKLITLFLRDNQKQIVGGLHGWAAFNYLKRAADNV